MGAPRSAWTELMRDALLAARGLDEAFRQAGTLLNATIHPRRAAEEVEDHIQREVEIRDRALQLRNVPDQTDSVPYSVTCADAALGRAVPALRGPRPARDTSCAPNQGVLLEQRGCTSAGD